MRLSHAVQSRPFGVALLIAGVDTQGPRKTPILSALSVHHVLTLVAFRLTRLAPIFAMMQRLLVGKLSRKLV